MVNLDLDLASLTATVWEAVVGLDPLCVSSGSEGSEVSAASTAVPGSLLAVVDLTGSWQATVVVRCSPRLGRRVAGAMFRLRPREVSEQDVSDSLAELTNIIGGTVKAAANLVCELSLPGLVPGGRLPGRLAGLDALHAVGFESDGESLEVTVIG